MLTSQQITEPRRPRCAVAGNPHLLGTDSFVSSYLEWPNPVEIRAAKQTGSGRGGGSQ